MGKRTFSEAQLDALEDAFQQNPYLNAELKPTLKDAGLTDSQIKNWFQNTRFKRRKNRSDPRLDFDLILGTSSSSSAPNEDEPEAVADAAAVEVADSAIEKPKKEDKPKKEEEPESEISA